MGRRLILIVPLVIFLGVAVFLYRGLSLDPTLLPSPLIGKPFPEFSLQNLDKPDEQITRQDIVGKVALVNVWATWCTTCKVEHDFLNRLAGQGITIYGINYKDKGETARDWLRRYQNPYQISIFDPQGSLGLDLGVYGAPETFLIDRQGNIHYRHAGDVNEVLWRETLEPLYRKLAEGEQP